MAFHISKVCEAPKIRKTQTSVDISANQSGSEIRQLLPVDKDFWKFFKNFNENLAKTLFELNPYQTATPHFAGCALRHRSMIKYPPVLSGYFYFSKLCPLLLPLSPTRYWSGQVRQRWDRFATIHIASPASRIHFSTAKIADFESLPFENLLISPKHRLFSVIKL